MNSDRLTTISSDIIIAGLNTKWTNAYSFLGFTFSKTTTDNGITFDSFNKNQFALDLSYYLEPEYILYLMFKNIDTLIQVTDGTNIIQLTTNNLKQILIHKWKRSITQLNSILNSIDIQDDNIIFSFSTLVLSTNDIIESARYTTEITLSNYFEKYLTLDLCSVIYHNLVYKYNINWDVINTRFSYKMELDFGHNLFIEKDQISLFTDNRHVILPYIDGNLTWNATYVSSNTSIATVDTGGLVKPISEGSCTITITDGLYGLSKVLTVNVTAHQLKLSSSILYIYGSDIKKLSCYIDDVKTSNVTYSSSDVSVATIDSNGYITRTGAGSCVITVADTLYGLVKTCKLNILDNVLTANIQTLSLLKGKTFQLVCYYNGFKTTNVTYQSLDPTLVTVSSTGLVTSVTNIKSADTGIVITNSSGMSTTLPVHAFMFDIDVTNLLSYYSAVGRSNTDTDYAVWNDLTEHGYDLLPYTNNSAGTTGLFSNILTAGWQNGWFVFDSVSKSKLGHWRMTPTEMNLTSGKNMVLAIRFKSLWTTGEMQLIGIRQGDVSWQLKQLLSNQLLFETTIWNDSARFYTSNSLANDTTVVIQTVSDTAADVYVNAAKIATISLSRRSTLFSYLSIGAEQQPGGWTNGFMGSIKAIALYDVTSQLKTDAELVQLSQDLMGLA